MSHPKTLLYDLPSKDPCASWSVNSWKARLALNFKNIPYETKWIEYPDIAPTFKSFGIPPGNGVYAYTVPTVRLPDLSYVSDSRAIATVLEERFPAPSFPSLHLDSPLLTQIEELIPKIHMALQPEWQPYVAPSLLTPRSKEYFERTRGEAKGMSLEQFAKEKGGEHNWVEATPKLKQVGALLREKGGPFVLGSTASYADFIIVSLLHMFKKIDQKLFDKTVGIEPALGELYEASKPWLENDQ